MKKEDRISQMVKALKAMLEEMEFFLKNFSLEMI